MNAATLQIAIEVDDRGSVKIRKLGRTARQAGEQADSGFKRAGRSLGDFNSNVSTSLTSVKALYTAIAGATAVVALTRISAASIKAASDLQEVSSKFDVVFRGQKEQAEAWSKTLVDSYAMSTRESKQYLSSVQDLLVPMGMQADMAGKMSMEVVKLSADLGSFNNLPTAQVMDDIQSALVGNYETMKKYGVVLNATAVQQKAMDMGLAATVKQLTAADKAQAAYKLIVEGSSAAIGDMARTSEGYANQLKKYHATIEDIKVAIGEGLLPVMTGLLSDFNEWYKVNGDLLRQDLQGWANGISEEIGKIADFGKEAGPYLVAIGTAAERIYTTADKLAAVGGPSTMEWGVIGWVLLRGNPESAALIGALTTINNSLAKFDLNIGSLSTKWQEYDKSMGDFVQSVKDWYSQSPEVQAFFGIYVDGAEKSIKATATLDQALSDLSSTFRASITNTDAEIKALEDFYTVTKKTGPAAQQTAKVVCEAHKRELTCAQKATKKAVEYDIKYHRDRYRNTDMFVGKIEADKRANKIIEEQNKATNDAISADLESAMSEQDDLWGFHAETVTTLQSEMVNDLGRIFDGYINDVLHGQIDSVGDLFKGLFDSILDMFMRTVSQMAANSLVDLLFKPGASGGPTLSSLFSGSSDSGGGGILSGISSLFSSGGGSASNGQSIMQTAQGAYSGYGASGVGSGQGMLNSYGSGGTAPLTTGDYTSMIPTSGAGEGIQGWVAENVSQGAADGLATATNTLGVVGGAYGVYSGIDNIANGHPVAGTVQTGVGGYSMYQGAVGLDLIDEGTATALWDDGVAYLGEHFGTAAAEDVAADTVGGYAAGEVGGELAYSGSETAALDAYYGSDLAAEGTGASMGSAAAYGTAAAVVAAVAYGIFKNFTQTKMTPEEAAYGGVYDDISGMGHHGLDYLDDDGNRVSAATVKFSTEIEAAFNTLTEGLDYDIQSMTNDLADSFTATGVDQFLEQMSGLPISFDQSATAMNLAISAADGNANSFSVLENYLESLGLTTEQAQASTVSMIEALNMQGKVTGKTVGAISGMTAAVNQLSNTNLDLEATARLNVEVMGDAKASSEIVGTSYVTSHNLGSETGEGEYNYWGWDDGTTGYNADGGIFTRPTVFRQVIGEAGPEAAIPLRHPKQLNHIEDKLDALLDALSGTGRPVTINIAGKTVADVILPAVDRHIVSRERSGISGRAVYAAG